MSYFRGAYGDDTDRPSLMERTGSAEEAMYGLITPGVGYKLGFATVDRTRFFRDLRARPLDMALEAGWCGGCARTSPASTPARSRPSAA